MKHEIEFRLPDSFTDMSDSEIELTGGDRVYGRTLVDIPPGCGSLTHYMEREFTDVNIVKGTFRDTCITTTGVEVFEEDCSMEPNVFDKNVVKTSTTSWNGTAKTLLGVGIGVAAIGSIVGTVCGICLSK